MSILTFYTASWCPDCTAAKRVLDEKGIKYNLIDIQGNQEAIDLIIEARGKKVVPTLEYNGSFIDGNHFDHEKFEKELDELLSK